MQALVDAMTGSIPPPAGRSTDRPTTRSNLAAQSNLAARMQANETSPVDDRMAEAHRLLTLLFPGDTAGKSGISITQPDELMPVYS